MFRRNFFFFFQFFAHPKWGYPNNHRIRARGGCVIRDKWWSCPNHQVMMLLTASIYPTSAHYCISYRNQSSNLHCKSINCFYVKCKTELKWGYLWTYLTHSSSVFVFNPLSASVALILKPVHWFALWAALIGFMKAFKAFIFEAPQRANQLTRFYMMATLSLNGLMNWDRSWKRRLIAVTRAVSSSMVWTCPWDSLMHILTL